VTGVIKWAVFAIYLSETDFGRSDESLKSAASIGGYDLKTYAKGPLAWIPVHADTGYWAVALNGITIGFTPLASNAAIAILDTGTSLILGPADEVLALTVRISAGRSCYEAEGALICDCGLDHKIEDYPVLYFRLGSNYFDLKPAQYFYRFGLYCRLLISSLGPVNFWVLGDVFLRRYYSVFDMDNQRIGLAISINSEDDEIPAPWSVIVFFVSLAIAVMSAVICLVCWMFLCGDHDQYYALAAN
jgi:hypothetical protein